MCSRSWSRSPHGAALALLLVLTGLPGCVGFTYVGTAITDDGVDVTGDRPHPPSRRPGPQREEDLLRNFGEPNERVVHSETHEEWVYEEGWRWNGPVLFVVIPIPLVIPVGHESKTYHLQDGVVERVVRVQQTWNGTLCGLMGHFAGCNSLQP